MVNKILENPKLTIIVPTRERADTLKHTIESLVAQDYSNLEILISDNFSQDCTKEIVDSFSDTRIRYINTGKRVSMSDNWEFALNYASGEFITYIGDDDGFMLGSVSKIMNLIMEKNVDAVAWQKIEYCWPNYIQENMRNWFSIKRFDNSLELIKSDKKLKKVMKFHESYTKLPCLYNSVVNASKIKELKGLSKTGSFFNSISPDVFSGIVLSKVIDRYIFSQYPFSINGASKHSNGTSLIKQSSSEKNTPAEKFRLENSLIYDSRLQPAPSVALCVMGEYLFAKESFPLIVFAEPNWRAYLKALIRNAHFSCFPNDLLESAKHTSNMLTMNFNVPINIEPITEFKVQNGFNKESFDFTVPENMVSNVNDAVRLLDGMLPLLLTSNEVSPIKRFLNRMYEVVIVEAKNLYKSL